ncbi:MAG TPA: YraN family protein [Patescibacteria group bacterium]|nr:YraN family protein [Patescibacteria group bacterium]
MSDPRHALGRAAEEAVAGWLTRAGWTILERRARAGGGGEVDLIVLDPGRTLVAIEVRARRTDRTGAAASTVDRRRIRRLEATLVAYASAGAPSHRGLRVDLVTVEPSASAHRWRLRRIPGIGGR